MTMRPSSSRIAGACAALAVTAGSACALLFPLNFYALGETRVRAICHVAFACCTPIERQLFANAPFKDEGACVAEGLEDSGFGFILNLDALAKDAVDRGAAEYDAEAAERCSRAQLDAVNACDVEALVDASGNFDLAGLILLTDRDDPECVALASRNYVRGLVDDGDECFSDIDCADFGTCVVEPPDDGEALLTVAGECLTPHAEGDACDDGAGCQPGLACAPGGDGLECQEIDLLDDGDPCTNDFECASGACEDVIVDGTCLTSGAACVDDDDCGDGDFCVGELSSTCAAADGVSVEICDGL